MAKYQKENPRINIKYLDGKTKEVLFQVKDRDWMNVGELLADHYVTELLNGVIKEEKEKPDSIIALVSAVYYKVE